MNTIHAPLLNGANLPWFNTPQPIDLDDLRGRLVILDFWTYCCINCLQIIPTLKKVENLFSDSLTVIGVHSPKFPGEKVSENVEKAITRYEIDHPVVHDPEMEIWQQYTVHSWPTLVFISPDGYVLGQLPGEPEPEMLVNTVSSLVEDYKNKGTLIKRKSPFLDKLENFENSTLRFPGKIAFSDDDKLFAITDANHHQVVIADLLGNIIHRIGSGESGHADGNFNSAQFHLPQGLCFHDGIIWVADTANHLLRKINIADQTVDTVAGTGSQGRILKGSGMGRQVPLSSPWDTALSDGKLYFANAGSHQIGVLEIESGIVSNFAGNGNEALIDGPRLSASFAQPSGLTIGDGKLFLADSETSAIRSINLDRVGQTTTYVGKGLFDFGDKDGNGASAELQHPLGVHYIEGALFIADSYNHKIRVLDLSNLDVHTVEASANIICTDKSCTRIWEPAGVILLEKNLYVSDTNNHRILKIDLDNETTEIFIG
jgi:thiol-disulfide isomerase/thioredoxin